MFVNNSGALAGRRPASEPHTRHFSWSWPAECFAGGVCTCVAERASVGQGQFAGAYYVAKLTRMTARNIRDLSNFESKESFVFRAAAQPSEN